MRIPVLSVCHGSKHLKMMMNRDVASQSKIYRGNCTMIKQGQGLDRNKVRMQDKIHQGHKTPCNYARVNKRHNTFLPTWTEDTILPYLLICKFISVV